MKDKIAKAIIVLLIVVALFMVIQQVFAYNITVLNQTIESNNQKIILIEEAKDNLHNTAECFRNEALKDNDFIKQLQTKWNSLDIEQKRMEAENEELGTKRQFLGTFELTAYYCGTRTSTGTVPTAGRTIAVDPKVIPYGTIVEIEGYGTYIAEDCGGAVKGNIIDIYIPGRENCIQFGRRKANVYIVKE